MPRLTEDEFEKFKEILRGLNWIEIMQCAIKMRETSWNDRPILEWRNASDTVCWSLIRELEEKVNVK